MSDGLVTLLTAALSGGLVSGLVALLRLRQEAETSSVATAERLVTMLERDLERQRARAESCEAEVARLRAELAARPGTNSSH